MIILVDIDGTLAIRNGREPFEWDLLATDVANNPVIEVVKGLSHLGHQIVYVSGRNEELRSATRAWLSTHVGIEGILLMRKDSDFRSDEVIKEELIRNHIDDLDSILLVIDDRNRVVKMWREQLGLTCLQVAEGLF